MGPTKTSFLRKLDQQYPIQFTQSAEYVTLQKSAREKTYCDGHPTNNYNSNDNTQYDDCENNSTISTSLLALPQQYVETIGLMRVPSAASLGVVTEGGVELYYDSDPGCAIEDDLNRRRSTIQITPENSPP